jgi:hypothetical protein
MGRARHVIGYPLTQETRVQDECDDVAKNIHQSHGYCSRLTECPLTQETRVEDYLDDVATTTLPLTTAAGHPRLAPKPMLTDPLRDTTGRAGSDRMTHAPHPEPSTAPAASSHGPCVQGHKLNVY